MILHYDDLIKEMQQLGAVDQPTKDLLRIAVDGINDGRYTVKEVTRALRLIVRLNKTPETGATVQGRL